MNSLHPGGGFKNIWVRIRAERIIKMPTFSVSVRCHSEHVCPNIYNVPKGPSINDVRFFAFILTYLPTPVWFCPSIDFQFYYMAHRALSGTRFYAVRLYAVCMWLFRRSQKEQSVCTAAMQPAPSSLYQVECAVRAYCPTIILCYSPLPISAFARVQGGCPC